MELPRGSFAFMSNGPLPPTTVLPPNPDDLQSTFIQSPPPQGSGFSGYSGFSGSLPGVSGFSGYSGAQSLAASYQSAIRGPFDTTSNAPVMMGIGGTITPLGMSGQVEVVASMDLSNSLAGSMSAAQLRIGIGLPPVFGAPDTGTAVGNTCFNAETNPSFMGSAVCSAIVSNLAKGTTYWIDLAFWVAPGFAGTTEATQVSILAHELGIGPPGPPGPQGISGFSGY